MLLLSSQRSVERTLTRSLVNGKPRLMTSQLRLKLAKRSVATTTANCTGSRLPMMKLLSNLMLSRGRTRILLMKSRISLINWEMVDAPSMNWTNNAAVWKLRRRSSNLPLRRPKLLLNKRRIRFSGLNLNLVKLDKRLIAASKRRRRSLIILGRTMRVQWSLWLLLLRVSNVPRVKPFASRKKLESDINELEIALDHANKANAEGQKAIKRYQNQLRETITGYEEHARGRQEVMEAVGIAERKAGALSGEVEESRALLDSADRSKRGLDAELSDARTAVNEMQVINTKAMHDKRGLESVIHTLQAEIDDALQAAKNSEDKSKRAMVDAARLADELRAEQDHVSAESRAKRSLDTQLGELENRLADAEAAAMKGGKSAMAKLEMKIRELELELGSVQSRTADSYKAFQRAERRVKELQFQQDEDHKNQDRMSDLANKLQQKIKTYKTQIEEAEEIAALNLAKYRKAQQELEETEERGKLAGAALGQL